MMRKFQIDCTLKWTSTRLRATFGKFWEMFFSEMRKLPKGEKRSIDTALWIYDDGFCCVYLIPHRSAAKDNGDGPRFAFTVSFPEYAERILTTTDLPKVERKRILKEMGEEFNSWILDSIAEAWQLSRVQRDFKQYLSDGTPLRVCASAHLEEFVVGRYPYLKLVGHRWMVTINKATRTDR